MKRVTLLVVLGMFAVIGTAQAQQKGAVEIGTDAIFQYAITGKFNDADVPDAFTFQLPAANLRVGFWVNEMISIEPAIGLSYVKITDDNGSTFDINGELSVLYNMPSGLFVRAGGVIFFENDSPGGGAESSSTSIFGFGGGVGYRTDLLPDLKLRFGADYIYTLKNEDDFIPSASNIMVGIGLSYFTK